MSLTCKLVPVQYREYEYGLIGHLRLRAVVGYGIKIFVPRPLYYVTRSPG